MGLIGHEYISSVVLLQLENYIMKDTKKSLLLFILQSVCHLLPLWLEIFILPNRCQGIV